jgi:CRISPR-associated protein Csx17
MSLTRPSRPSTQALNLIALPGCTPEPLMNYLKALGVFRLVSEQLDPQCRAAWRDGRLALFTNLSEEEVIAFFAKSYQPSPHFSPWNGDGGFLTESGASFSTIEAIRTSTDARLAPLREAITKIGAMAILKDFGQSRAETKTLEKKKKAKRATPAELAELKKLTKRVKTLKETILFQIRTEFPDNAIGWFDTCLQVGEDGFSVAPVLGSGGVDGRMEFSANFLANILLVLDHAESPAWIASSLFARGLAKLHPASIGQFSPGDIGGPNATHGFEGSSTINPWDYILLIEGTPLLAGAISRRCRTAQFGRAAFPFTVTPTAQDGDSVEQKDSNTARGEIWLPLWRKPIRLAELERLFGEGRAEWSGGQSRTSVDFAKAVAAHGIDRGIESFSRHGFLQRNGLAFLATPIGRFDVRAREDVHLLREADPWIERFRRACTDKTPARFSAALRRIDSAVFDYCRFGNTERFQAILIALGQAERSLADGTKFRESAWLHPLRGLSSAWVNTADDGSPEFEIALALAAIRGESGDPGLRANLEPVARNSKGRIDWKEGSADAVWTRGNLAANLGAVLGRRVLSWRQHDLPAPTLTSCRHVHLSSVSAFLHAELDDEKIENLLWGLLGCRIEPRSMTDDPRPPVDAPPLPRCYPLLKTAFTGLHSKSFRPKNLNPQQADLWSKLVNVRPDARLLQFLAAGDLPEACNLATRRARNAELTPAIERWQGEPIPSELCPTRLAAALLLPISPHNLIRLWTLIARKELPEQANS